MDSFNEMAELLFADITKTPADYEEEYPPRNLEEGAIVTRFAPSPTGFLHFGGLFAAFIEKTAAKTTNGIFYLRIEDTDKKREVENGVSLIVKGLNDFGIEIDEGMLSETEEKGAYGPYTQSKRTPIYQAYVKSLVQKGLAYPCFMSEDELNEVRQRQEADKLLPGIYGEFAKYRDITVEEAKQRIENGEEYVVRLKSPGSADKRIKFKDAIKGEIEMPENILDVVLLKKDGTPTYHFAHAVDDHLMRTTHVIRGDEWISSVPIHLQLFYLLGFKAPKYVHISPIMKEENGGKRKLSKRKDPEAAVSYYSEVGFPKGAIWEYLMTLANSNYEDWRLANKDADIEEFKFALNKMSKAGALFDLVKLTDVSKNYISTLNAEEVYEMVTEWAQANNEKLYDLLVNDEEYAKAIFAIERGNAKPRKDIGTWSDVENYVSYFYRELWDRKRDFAENLTNEDMIEILERYKEVYDENGAAEDWFPTVRDMAVEMGYAKAPKEYKKNPD
ncbi:MAG: glutamate--tRNA ligase, partial [Clostridia bacterium]|nr:glutamate--tRNA ligase [Clostridia bacterium]